jgi:hypothetical protein
MIRIINECTVNREVKKLTKKSYSLLHTLNRNNYIKIFEDYKEKVENIFNRIKENQLDKSLFLDFMNYVKELEYLYDMITLNDMQDKEIQTLWNKEKDYITALYLTIQAITPTELR